MSELSDEYDLLSVEIGERADRVATVTIERPDARNALNGRVRSELKDAVTAADADDDVRALVVTGGEESGAFVAGADVTEFRERGVVEQREASERPRIYETVDDASIPVIARINGHALGGGCELAMACDVRIAQSGVKIGQPEINLGIIPGGGGTQRLPRLVGEGQAMKLILSGELLDAEEAREIGLVDEVHDEGGLDGRVDDLAGSMATKSPIALEFAKNAIKASSRMGLEEGIEYEAELFAQLFATEDKDEGIEAFLEGRDPEFIGR
ncbi:enoyl-CoA hydratase/isomerase family protein [Haloterrigena sp. SYSU A121-1]|uniref:Enoyl-CoA hydratase/isomerase family protein n=1 Tax=Haloterrigena gelatinilytica TaxID=2741724 RepID=A0A8J8GSN0_9EURY|nr:enoyl-CoA hydratase-related protein [Haloterrigena gelatinilytica]NUB93789.1 enoyl-CoA hydratase/isomerase family protein [Haloterrigena gelatinilytica]